MTEPTEAKCPNCGAALGATPPGGEYHCAFCGHVSQASPQLRSRAGAGADASPDPHPNPRIAEARRATVDAEEQREAASWSARQAARDAQAAEDAQVELDEKRKGARAAMAIGGMFVVLGLVLFVCGLVTRVFPLAGVGGVQFVIGAAVALRSLPAARGAP